MPFMITGLVSAVKDALSPRAAPTQPTPIQLFARDVCLQQELNDAGLALGRAIIELTQHRETRGSDVAGDTDAWDAEHARLVSSINDAHRRIEAARETRAFLERPSITLLAW